MPVISRVWSAEANDALRTPSRSQTAWFTSSRQVAGTTHAQAIPGSLRAATTIVLADSSGETPYLAQNAAVSANSGSHAIVSCATPSAASLSRTMVSTADASSVSIASARPTRRVLPLLAHHRAHRDRARRDPRRAGAALGDAARVHG